MPGLWGPPQQNPKCTICGVPQLQKLMRQCPWCESFPICSNCLVTVEGSPDARICYLCCVPKCNLCDWQGEDVQTLSYYYPTGDQGAPVHRCPSCQQYEVVASKTAPRVPPGHYASSDPLRVDPSARRDIEEALKNAGW